MTARPRRPSIARGLRRIEWYRRAEIAVAGFILWLALWLLRRVVHLQILGVEGIADRWRQGLPSVLAFWHGRSIMLPFLQPHAAACGAEVWIMNSPHRDGQIVSRALERFGIRCTEGSSSRGAVAGTLHLARALRRGVSIALAADGPRGPAGVAKPGAMELASISGTPVYPLAISASRSVRLGSWDRLMIPLPGSRVVCVVGEPLLPAATNGRLDRAALTGELERRLGAICSRADVAVGRPAELQ
jgi:lysophospholipid acyltransferase (LPLAT)-like uncharacterized protein